MNPLSEEQQKKAQDFLKEYGELIEKHKFDFVHFPMFIPDGQGAFKVIIQSQPVDTSEQPVKSNFMAE